MMTTTLSELIDKHRVLEFPDFPEDDEFADWAIELLELDGFYVGCAVSKLHGDRSVIVREDELVALHRSLRAFEAQAGLDNTLYMEFEKYLCSLNKLVDEMVGLQDIAT